MFADDGLIGIILHKSNRSAMVEKIIEQVKVEASKINLIINPKKCYLIELFKEYTKRGKPQNRWLY